ncbi:MAG: amidohydrolase family protein [Oligoflexales bacterium]
MNTLQKNSFSIACELAFIPNTPSKLSSALVSWEDGMISKLRTSPSEDWQKSLKSWKQEIPDLRVYENKLLTPAFINPHTHITMNLFRGLSASVTSTKGNMIEDLFYHIESYLTYEDVLAFSRIGAYENILNGVGLVWDHYYHGTAIANALKEVGLTGVVAPTLQDLAGPGKNRWEEEWEKTLTIHQDTDNRESGIFAAFGPHASDTCSADLWKKVILDAKKLQIPIHCHISQSVEEYKRILEREGCSPVSWLSKLGLFSENIQVLAVHNIFSDKNDLEILGKGKQINLCFCPFSSLVFALPSATDLWDHYQIPWCIGTDCVASNDSMNIQKELRFVAGMPMYNLSRSNSYLDFLSGNSKQDLSNLSKERQQLWEKSRMQCSSETLLSKVWDIPGSIHPQLQVGKIAKDHLANLIIWDFDDPSIWPSRSLHTIAMGDSNRAIYQMICNGTFMGKDGQFEASIRHSVDFQEHLKEAKARYDSMLNRCGLK